MLDAPRLFDERDYRTAYPDVAAAANRFETTPFEHFLRFGQFEGRNPGPFFNTEFYLERNSDVAAAVQRGEIAPIDHFVRFGQFEGRTSSPFYDRAFYLTNNGDVAAAVARDELTGIEHFVRFGQYEDRDPSRFFDADYYKGRNPDVAAFNPAFDLSGFRHFVIHGQFEGRAPRQLFGQTYVFGDSLVDDGNSFDLTGGRLPPSPPYFQGRFTNGPVWTERYAPALGLPLDPATNLAIGGATTGTANTNNGLLPEGTPFQLPGLQTQIDTYLAAGPADPAGLYILWAGGNDYLAGRSTDVAGVVGNLVAAVQKLAAAGARNVMLVNLPDLGGLPLARTFDPTIVAGLSQLTAAHNRFLAEAATQLEATSGGRLNLIVTDAAAAFDALTNNPAAFGLENVTESYLPVDFFDNPTQPLPNLAAGVDPTGFAFWDAIHPTAAVHDILSNVARATTTSLPEVVEIL